MTFKYVYDLETKYGKPQIAANSEEEALKRYKKMFPEGTKAKSATLAYRLKKKSKDGEEN
jgi:hypothetical protein